MESNYAWLVAVAAAHICVALHDGITRALGVMLPTLVEELDTDVTTLGSVIALMATVGSIASLFLGVLSDHVHPRVITVAAGVSASLGLALCMFSYDVTTLALCLVLLTGPGLRCAYVLLMAELGIHFNQYFAFACGFAVAGVSTGEMIFAPLTELFVDKYGWKATFLLLGAITLHIVPCSFAIQRRRCHKNNNNNNNNNHVNDATPLIPYADIKDDSETAKEHEKKPENAMAKILRLLRTTFDLNLFCNLAFTIVLVSLYVDEVSWMIWLLFLVPHAEELRLYYWHIDWITTLGSFSNAFGKLAVTFLVAQNNSWSFIFLAFTLTLSGTALIFVRLSVTFPSFFILSLVYECMSGATFALTFALTRDFSNIFSLTKIMSWLILSSGLARLTGGSIGGWIHDITGNYTGAFMFSGIPLVLDGLIMIAFHRFCCMKD